MAIVDVKSRWHEGETSADRADWLAKSFRCIYCLSRREKWRSGTPQVISDVAFMILYGTEGQTNQNPLCYRYTTGYPVFSGVVFSQRRRFGSR
jgi:hypothetical protein